MLWLGSSELAEHYRLRTKTGMIDEAVGIEFIADELQDESRA